MGGRVSPHPVPEDSLATSSGDIRSGVLEAVSPLGVDEDVAPRIMSASEVPSLRGLASASEVTSNGHSVAAGLSQWKGPRTSGVVVESEDEEEEKEVVATVAVADEEEDEEEAEAELDVITAAGPETPHCNSTEPSHVTAVALPNYRTIHQ